MELLCICKFCSDNNDDESDNDDDESDNIEDTVN